MIVLTSTKDKCIEAEAKYPDLEFYHLPCIEYIEPKDGYKAIDAAIRTNHLYEWIFFLSQKAADTYFERLLAIGGNFFNLSNHLKFAVIGKTTKDFLEKEVNMPVDFMPSKANSQTFIEEFCTKYSYEFNCEFKVLLPRSELASDDFKEKLESSKNYIVDIVAAYNTVLPSFSFEDHLEKLKKASAIVFTSPSCVDNFFKISNAWDISELTVHSIGPKTTQAFERLYPSHEKLIETSESNLDSLLQDCH